MAPFLLNSKPIILLVLAIPNIESNSQLDFFIIER